MYYAYCCHNLTKLVLFKTEGLLFNKNGSISKTLTKKGQVLMVASWTRKNEAPFPCRNPVSSLALIDCGSSEPKLQQKQQHRAVTGPYSCHDQHPTFSPLFYTAPF